MRTRCVLVLVLVCSAAAVSCSVLCVELLIRMELCELQQRYQNGTLASQRSIKGDQSERGPISCLSRNLDCDVAAGQMNSEKM